MIAASRWSITAFAINAADIDAHALQDTLCDVSREIKGAKGPRKADDPGVTCIPTHPLVRKHCALRTAWSPQDCLSFLDPSRGSTKIQQKKFLARPAGTLRDRGSFPLSRGADWPSRYSLASTSCARQSWTPVVQRDIFTCDNTGWIFKKNVPNLNWNRKIIYTFDWDIYSSFPSFRMKIYWYIYIMCAQTDLLSRKLK